MAKLVDVHWEKEVVLEFGQDLRGWDMNCLHFSPEGGTGSSFVSLSSAWFCPPALAQVSCLTGADHPRDSWGASRRSSIDLALPRPVSTSLSKLILKPFPLREVMKVPGKILFGLIE